MNADGEGPIPVYEEHRLTEAQKSGRVITVPLFLRWVEYKKGSSQLRSGIKGRWQVCDDYGWRNSDFTPTMYLKTITKP